MDPRVSVCIPGEDFTDYPLSENRNGLSWFDVFMRLANHPTLNVCRSIIVDKTPAGLVDEIPLDSS